jgi:predicted dehydrogenase
MSKEVKIGIIGTGVGIRTHLKGFRGIEGCKVLAITGSSKARSEEFAEKYDIPLACADYKELCDLEEIDLVCVCSPNKYHFETVKYAMAKGKNVICEKPVSHITEEVNRLSLIPTKTGTFVYVDHQLRFNPYMRKIKEIIQNDTLGHIYLVRINQVGLGFSDNALPWSWSFDGTEGGGVRLAMASHFNDLIQFWFNSRRVMAVTGNLNPIFKERNVNNQKRKVTASTLCNAQIQLEDEVSVMYSINAGGFSSFKFEIDMAGDKGELHFDLNNKLSLFTANKKGIEQIIDVDGVFEDERQNKASLFSGSFRYFAPLVIRKLLGENVEILNDAATIEQAKYNCKILDAIKKASNTGVPVVFSSEENNYV